MAALSPLTGVRISRFSDAVQREFMARRCIRGFIQRFPKNIYETDLSQIFQPKEVLFAVLSLAALFPLAMLLPWCLEPDQGKAAAMGQAIMRTNYILFGIAVAESIYGEGNVGDVALLGAVIVPLTNAFSVVILESGRSGRVKPGKLLLSILKNPMVLAALAALTLMATPFHLPALLWKVVENVAGVTTTISFISLEISLNLGEIRANLRSLLLGTVLRMVLVPLVFLPLSVALGFRGQSLCGLMVLFAAPTTVPLILWQWPWGPMIFWRVKWSAPPRLCRWSQCSAIPSSSAVWGCCDPRRRPGGAPVWRRAAPIQRPL